MTASPPFPKGLKTSHDTPWLSANEPVAQTTRIIVSLRQILTTPFIANLTIPDGGHGVPTNESSRTTIGVSGLARRK